VEETGVAYDSYWEFEARLPGGEGIADNYAVEYDEVRGSDYGVLFRGHARRMAAKDGKGDGKGYDKEGGEGR